MIFDNLIKAFIPRQNFNSSVLTLLSGTTLALLIAYAAQPVLTRLYSPESFGTFDTFLALLTILIPFASLRYEDAIMLPKRNEEALHVLGLSLILIFLASLLSTGIALMGPAIENWFDTSGLSHWLIWIPPILFSVRLSKIGELWLSRKKRYSPISTGQVAQSGLMAGTRIVLGRIGPSSSPLGLFTGYLAGHVASMSWFTYLIVRKEKRIFRHLFNPDGIRGALIRYRRFPYFSMSSTLLSALISRLPFLLLLYFFDGSTVGYFGRAYALFAVPLSLIGNAISQVFFVDGMEAYRTNKLHSLTRRVHARLILLGLFPALGLMIAGPDIFGFILGEQWTVAGQYLQWIAPWLFLAGIASPLTRLFDILEQQRLDLIASILMFIVQTTALIAGGLSGNIFTCLFYVSLGGSTARLIQLGIMFSLSRVSMKHIARDYLLHIALSAPFLLLLFGMVQQESPLLTTVVGGVCGLAYLAIAFRFLHREDG